MGNNIEIKRTSSPVATYTIRNLQVITISLTMPVEIIPLVEDNADNAQLIKFLGNSTKVGIDWMLLDESSSVVTESTVQTAMEQLNYLHDTFQNVSFNSDYQITIDDGVSDTNNFVKGGLPSLFTATKSGDEAIMWRAHIDFFIGAAIVT